MREVKLSNLQNLLESELGAKEKYSCTVKMTGIEQLKGGGVNKKVFSVRTEEVVNVINAIRSIIDSDFGNISKFYGVSIRREMLQAQKIYILNVFADNKSIDFEIKRRFFFRKKYFEISREVNLTNTGSKQLRAVKQDTRFGFRNISVNISIIIQ